MKGNLIVIIRYIKIYKNIFIIRYYNKVKN